MNQPTTPATTPASELPPLTANIFGMLALRTHRLNTTAFSFSGLQPRVTREVELYLTCYRIRKEREQRQTLLEGLLTASALKAFIDQAKVKKDELVVAIEAAETDDEKRVLLGRLVELTNIAGDAVARLQAMEGGQNG